MSKPSPQQLGYLGGVAIWAPPTPAPSSMRYIAPALRPTSPCGSTGDDCAAQLILDWSRRPIKSDSKPQVSRLERDGVAGYFIQARTDLDAWLLVLSDVLNVRFMDLAYLHTAAVAIDGVGVLVEGAGGIGKTSSVIDMVKLDARCQFIADDIAMVSSSADILGLQKSIYLYPYHEPLLRRHGLTPASGTAPSFLLPAISRLRETLRPAIERVPTLLDYGRRFTPEHTAVAPSSLFSTDEIVTDPVPLGLCLSVSRGDASLVGEIENPSGDRFRAIANRMWKEYPERTRRLLGVSGAESTHVAQKSEIVRHAFASAKWIDVQIPEPVSARETARIIGDVVDAHLR
jgi:hypothetical protein